MKISTYIFELLQSHDCVIVPNFGAFVTRNISAKISSDGSRIFPPNKEISFNKNKVLCYLLCYISLVSKKSKYVHSQYKNY